MSAVCPISLWIERSAPAPSSTYSVEYHVARIVLPSSLAGQPRSLCDSDAALPLGLGAIHEGGGAFRVSRIDIDSLSCAARTTSRQTQVADVSGATLCADGATQCGLHPHLSAPGSRQGRPPAPGAGGRAPDSQLRSLRLLPRPLQSRPLLCSVSREKLAARNPDADSSACCRKKGILQKGTESE